MADNSNKVSYTSKTTESIFKDLVAAIPDLTNKWKNYAEDDPGIALLKLMAYTGDMLCYNMDYQVNECFPQTAYQRRHAQKSYDLIGYKMHWYRSAETKITITFNRPEGLAGASITIPIPSYSTILSASGVPYTLVGNTSILDTLSLAEGENSVTSRQLLAIQGISSKLIINKSSILPSGRIYLQDNFQIEEDEANNPSTPHMTLQTYSNNVQLLNKSWTKVSNLLGQVNVGRYYEFGIDENSLPYIQLNEGWQEYISESSSEYLVLTYITSSGTSGAVAENVGFKFNRSFPFQYSGITYDLGKFFTINNTQSTAGANPETVAEASISGPKEACTLGVAVTLGDYNILAPKVDNVRAANALDVATIPASDTTVTGVTPEAVNNYITLQLSDIYKITPGSLTLTLGSGADALVYNDYNGTISSANNAQPVGSVTYNSSYIHMYFAGTTGTAFKAEFQQSYPSYSVLLDIVPHDYRYITDEIRTGLDTYFSSRKVSTVSLNYRLAALHVIPFNIEVYPKESTNTSNTMNIIMQSINNVLYNYFNASYRTFGEKLMYPDLVNMAQNSDNMIQYLDILSPERTVKVPALKYPMLGPVAINYAEGDAYTWLYDNIIEESSTSSDNRDAAYVSIFGADSNNDIDFSKVKNTNSSLNGITDKLDLTNSISITINNQSVTLGVKWWSSRPDLINVNSSDSTQWGNIITGPLSNEGITPVTLYATITKDGAEYVATQYPVSLTIAKKGDIQ